MFAVATMSDWLVLSLVGGTFTLLGVLKLYGLSRRIVGGGNKASSEAATNPDWNASAAPDRVGRAAVYGSVSP
jgi:hypothetical protein